MAVIYLFDQTRQLKKPVLEGVQEIIHMEGEYEAVAQILAKDAPANGEYFGFRCMDERFRLFLIRLVEIDDESGTCMITGTDAAIAELDTSIVTELSLQNTTAVQAITGALQSTGWTIGQQMGNGQVNTESAYFATRWTAIKTAAAEGGVRAVPYYEFSGNRITAKKVDVLDKTPVFSGLIYTRKRGAQNIHITREGIPYGRVYPVGKIIGDSEPPEQLTIADAVWSRAKGDPADKPAGQLYIDLPGAFTTAEYVYEDKRETDPTRLMEKAFHDLQSTGRPTASGTANLNEMQHAPGYEHMTAQMWMMAVVRAESGEMVETTIIDIERYYVHTELTKITVGDEKTDADALENMLANMQSMIIDAAKVAGGGRAGAGKAKKMVLEAEELIQLNSKRIELNANEISLRAFDADVKRIEDETEVLFQEVRFDINADRARIDATETLVDNIGNRVTIAEGELVVQAGEISQRVMKDGIIGAINLTPEDTLIQSKRINLEGYVTMSKFEAEIGEIDNIFAGYSQAQYLHVNNAVTAQSGQFTNISLINYDCSWKTPKMGEITLPDYLGKKNDEEMNLEHSHAVTVNDDGTITLGEVSSSGGTFKIADTTYYKNGVSASYNKGKTDWSPVAIQRTGYSTADKTVTTRAVNAAGVPLIALEDIDASEIFDAGAQSVIDEVVIGCDQPSSIIHIGDNVYQMRVRIWAKYNGDTIQATTVTLSKGLYN